VRSLSVHLGCQIAGGGPHEARGADAQLGYGAPRSSAGTAVCRTGALVVSLAECQIAAAECSEDIENVRADRAGRAVADTPSALPARSLSRA
jgi:hypothetical protein